MSTARYAIPESKRTKQRAAAAARYAVRSGRLPGDLPCEACGAAQRTGADGRPTVIGHHFDYSRPLDTIPLCKSCHSRVHAGTLPEPRTGRVYDKRSDRKHMQKIIANGARREQARATIPLIVGRMGVVAACFAIGVKPTGLRDIAAGRYMDNDLVDRVLRIAVVLDDVAHDPDRAARRARKRNRPSYTFAGCAPRLREKCRAIGLDV